jgi:hypothetical protein
MNKTYVVKNHEGYTFNLLALPDTNYFKFEIVNKIGSHIEKLYKEETGKNVYGISHLIEHLSFKSPQDFTSTELNKLLLSEGTYNASTDKDRINYWFETTMDRCDLGIKIVSNIAFNTLNKISFSEFEIEKSVVINEVKRYNDNDQNMFWYNCEKELCEYEENDNVIGDYENISNFTLDNCIVIKDSMQNGKEHIFNVTYDPEIVCAKDLMSKLVKEIKRFSPLNLTTPIDDKKLEVCKNHPSSKSYHSENKSEQVLTYINIDCVKNIFTANFANSYFASYSDTSLNELIREQNGLTYGIYFATSRINGKEFTYFGCDVTSGTEDKMLELFEESIVKSTNEFTKEKYEEFMKIKSLKRTMNLMNRKTYNSWHDEGTWHPDIIEDLKPELENNIDLAYSKFEELYCTYEQILEYMKELKNKVISGDYGIVQNKKV